ncbi:Endothelin-converting enzyme 1, partial [Stegodyphus mimosarum]
MNTHFPFDIYPPMVSVLTEAYDNKFFKIRVLLEKDTTEDESYEDLLKSMYWSCMKTEKIEEKGIEPLRDILDSLGGWPMLKGNSWEAASFDWIETLRRLRELGYDHSILIGLQVTSNKIFGLPHTIMLDHASLGIPRSSMLDLNHEERFLYYLWIFRTAQEMDTKKQNLQLENEIWDALNFETMLAEISTSNEDSVDHLYEPHTIKDLLSSEKEIDWLRLFNALLNEEVTENERLFIKDKNFVTKFADLMKKTDK